MNQAYKQYNSPHNTSSFILGSLFTGLFYSIWGFFTGILGWNLIEFLGLYLSPWVIIFGFPYLFYGGYLLYSCFTKYSLIYFGNASIKPRKYAIVIIILFLTIEICFTMFFYINLDLFTEYFSPTNTCPDLTLLIFSFFAIYLLIRHGIFGRRVTVTQISRRIQPDGTIITTRTTSSSSTSPSGSRRSSQQRVTTIRTPSSRSTTRQPRSNQELPRLTSRTTQQRTSRQGSTTRTRKTSTPRTTQTRKTSTPRITQTRKRTQTVKTTRLPSGSVTKAQFDKYKPKSGILTEEDFKCIFCFKLPNLDDKDQGIILCPKCKHPAHVNEFKDWAKESNLCSRCNAAFSSNFLKNPPVISIKNYLKIYNYFLKRKKR